MCRISCFGDFSGCNLCFLFVFGDLDELCSILSYDSLRGSEYKLLEFVRFIVIYADFLS